jgi:uncharacterized surface protein with fasciclin (FAS1) repeats
MSNIVEMLTDGGNLSTLLKSIKATQLEDDLSKEGPFTVFAPTNFAFGKIGEGGVDELMKPENKSKLTTLLYHHVVEGRKSFNDLKDGMVMKTVNGKELTVKIKNGDVRINGSKIQARDMKASNGVMHSVERIIPIA